MSDWRVIAENGNERPVDSRSEAEEVKEEMEQLGMTVEIEAPTTSDGGEVQGQKLPIDEQDPNEPIDVRPSSNQPETKESPQEQSESDTGIIPGGSMADPLKTLPGWMITQVSYSDRGDTTTTVNKRGCQVIANYLGLESKTEAVTRASETGFEYAEFKAIVETPDGRTFTGHGTARADGEDQSESDGWKLDMQAETRSYKRAVKAATGGGVQAFDQEQK